MQVVFTQGRGVYFVVEIQQFVTCNTPRHHFYFNGVGGYMQNLILGEVGDSSSPEDILSQVSLMDSETIHELINAMWLLYDEAAFMEGKHLFTMGPQDPHWEDHL